MTQIGGDAWTVHHGDCREVFRALPAGSVHCIVTSPPYWGGVRDYGIAPVRWADGWEGCFGNEPLVEQYVAHTLEIFEALGHALREDGVIFWNIGDCYSTGKGSMHNPGGGAVSLHNRVKEAGGLVSGAAPNRMPQSIAPGNKSLVPFRVALALQDAGWVIRQDTIWRKPSPMPESIDGWRWERCKIKIKEGVYNGRRDPNRKDCEFASNLHHPQRTEWAPCPGCNKCRANDGYVLRRGAWRPTTAHEFVFQIVKSPEYFCDAQSAAELATCRPPGNKDAGKFNGMDQSTSMGRRSEAKNTGAMNCAVETRNPRSIWTISSEPYKGKHFAAFPTMLAWKCIQAATSAGGCCPACGAPYAPIVQKCRVPTRPGEASKFNKWKQDEASKADGQRSTASPNRDPQRHVAVKRTLGYRATCACNAGDPVPCTVADPFTGSGTTMQVAIHAGRRFVGSEIAAHYLPLIQERAATPWQPKEQRTAKPKARRKRHHRERALF